MGWTWEWVGGMYEPECQITLADMQPNGCKLNTNEVCKSAITSHADALINAVTDSGCKEKVDIDYNPWTGLTLIQRLDFNCNKASSTTPNTFGKSIILWFRFLLRSLGVKYSWHCIINEVLPNPCTILLLNPSRLLSGV